MAHDDHPGSIRTRRRALRAYRQDARRAWLAWSHRKEPETMSTDLKTLTPTDAHSILRPLLNGDDVPKEVRDDARRVVEKLASSLAYIKHGEWVDAAVEAFEDAVRDNPDMDPTDALHEACDGFLIYTVDAEALLSVSENADYALEEFGDGAAKMGVSARATYALEQDVVDKIGDLDSHAATVRLDAYLDAEGISVGDPEGTQRYMDARDAMTDDSNLTAAEAWSQAGAEDSEE